MSKPEPNGDEWAGLSSRAKNAIDRAGYTSREQMLGEQGRVPMFRRLVVVDGCGDVTLREIYKWLGLPDPYDERPGELADLPTRARSTLRNMGCYTKADALAAFQTDPKCFLNNENFGQASYRDLLAWLGVAKPTTIRGIDDAIELLKRHGYKVTKVDDAE